MVRRALDDVDGDALTRGDKQLGAGRHLTGLETLAETRGGVEHVAF